MWKYLTAVAVFSCVMCSKIVQAKLVLISKSIFKLIHHWENFPSSEIHANSSVIRQKGESQNGCFQKTKARQIFRKTNISYPLIRTRASAYQGVRNIRFSENLACFCFFETPVLRFTLLPYYRQTTKLRAEVTNNSFKDWFLSSVLLTDLRYLEGRTCRLIQIISTVISRGLERS